MPYLFQQLLLNLGWCQLLGDDDKVLHGQQANRVLVVGFQLAIYGQRICQDMWLGEVLDKGLRTRRNFVSAVLQAKGDEHARPAI
jgi:hypothetical protein